MVNANVFNVSYVTAIGQNDRYRVPQKVFLLNIFLNKNQLLFSYFFL